MKQRVTIEQINSLTDAQKKVIRQWWKPENYDDFEVVWDGERNGIMEYWEDGNEFGYGSYFTPKNQCLPLLSIGQMIDYLQSTGNDWTLHGSDWDSKDICDLLWKRVVHYL